MLAELLAHAQPAGPGRNDKARLAPGAPRRVDRARALTRPRETGGRRLVTTPRSGKGFKIFSRTDRGFTNQRRGTGEGALAPSPSCTGRSWTSPDLLAVPGRGAGTRAARPDRGRPRRGCGENGQVAGRVGRGIRTDSARPVRDEFRFRTGPRMRLARGAQTRSSRRTRAARKLEGALGDVLSAGRTPRYIRGTFAH